MSYLYLYSNCIPVKGVSRSIICDLQQGKYDFIPNSLYEILNTNIGKKRHSILEQYTPEEQTILEEYFGFLEHKEYIYWVDDITQFPPIEKTYQSSSHVTNAIIDFDEKSHFNLTDISDQLDFLNCKAIQFRFFCSKEMNELNEILQSFELSKLRSIELIIKFQDTVSIKTLQELHKSSPRIKLIIIHSSPEQKLDFLNREKTIPVMYTNQVFNDSSCCGKIGPSYFSINTETFIESLNFNSCLNKKISIDTNGDIKNCPSLPTSYGNISNTSLYSALHSEGFKDVWKLTKDMINVCKDCEFRHICTDCRAYTDNPNNKYARPSKCTYNPYICKWQGEKGFKTLEECGITTDKNGLYIDHKKVSSINKELWGE